VGIILGIAVAVSVVWVLRLVLGEVSKRDRAVRQREMAEHEAERRLTEAMERPGLTPDNPLTFTSAAAIEPRAEAEPCPICDGSLHVETHEVDEHGPRRLRVLTLKCGDCGRRTTMYAELEALN
jgi:hypothetical protein